MPIKIEMLRYFVAVARSGTLAHAADQLGRTPSAVSMMLKQFEEHLQHPLFESERKSNLTALGRFALEEAELTLTHFERAVSVIESFARSESGFVRVAAVPSVAERILPAAVQAFLADRPGVRIDIQDMDTASVIRELEAQRVDIGIATGVEVKPEIAQAELMSDAFGVVCRVDHPLTRISGPLPWAALEPWPLIGNALCELVTDPGFRAILANSQLKVRNTTSILAMARAGVGVALLPRLVVEETESELCFLPVADRSARRRIDTYRRAHAALTPAAQTFVEILWRIAQDRRQPD